jgi:hypothetical protein
MLRAIGGFFLIIATILLVKHTMPSEVTTGLIEVVAKIIGIISNLLDLALRLPQ